MKHIFDWCKPLNPATIKHLIEQWSRRISWAWHFQAGPGRSEEKDRCPALIRREVLPYTGILPPELKAMLDRISKAGMDAVVTANKAIKMKALTMKPPAYISAALKWLKANSRIALPTDKDGVFAITTKSALERLVTEQLNKEFYKPLSEIALEVAHRQLMHSLSRIYKASDAIDRPKWSREIAKALGNSSPEALLCPIACTIKTHKTPVKARLLHNSAGSALSVLGCIVNKLIGPKLLGFPWLVTSTGQATDQIRSLGEVARTVTFVKMDVKDFYLSGDHQDIIEEVVKYFSGPEKTLLENCMQALLCNQFVEAASPFNHLNGQKLFQVTKGSGMGLKHAGALSDFLFAIADEKSEIVRKAPGLFCYLRYRDDVLAIMERASFARPWVDKIVSEASKFFILELEEVSTVGVAFLDLFVYRKVTPEGTCRISFSPYIKDTANHVPLGPGSLHHRSVHEHWPVMEVARMCRLSRARSTEQHFRERKIRRFRLFFLGDSTLRSCTNFRLGVRSRIARSVLVESVPHRAVRLVLPYRNECSKIVSAVSDVFNLFKSLVGSTGLKVCLGYAFSRGFTNLRTLLRRN